VTNRGDEHLVHWWNRRENGTSMNLEDHCCPLSQIEAEYNLAGALLPCQIVEVEREWSRNGRRVTRKPANRLNFCRLPVNPQKFSLFVGSRTTRQHPKSGETVIGEGGNGENEGRWRVWEERSSRGR